MSLLKQVLLGLLPWLIMYMTSCSYEVPKAKTVMRGGLLYKMGQDAPYTGLVFGKARASHHTRMMSYKKAYKKGLLNGKTYFYYPNGKIESVVPYSKGKIHGALVCYWPNGKPKSRIHFVNGFRGGTNGEMFWDSKGHQI